MRNYLKLNSVLKNGTFIIYSYEVSGKIKKYFTDKEFKIIYKENIESVPEGVLAIPFVCSVLPIVWLTDSELIVPELEHNFLHCIDQVKKGYEVMFPESKFLGTITVLKDVTISDNTVEENVAMFYSGGVDSMQTLYAHIGEKPNLVSIWGADIRFNNAEGWKKVYTAVEEAAECFKLKHTYIQSSFRDFDNERILGQDFESQLKDSWWHGVKHGIALIGHVAPYAYLHHYTKVYIASTNTAEDGKVRCASHPSIDNNIRFMNCKVIHDGFEWDRKAKIHKIAVFNHSRGNILPLHVCWQSQEGGNCCHCEKCYRTILQLIIEGEDPSHYGFQGFEKQMKSMYQNIALGIEIYKDPLILYWPHIQKQITEKQNYLQQYSYWKYLKWILNADFSHPEKIQGPMLCRLEKRIKSKLRTFAFYKELYKIKKIFRQ